MKTSPLVAASAVFLAAGVSAHGNITSPPARQPGAAMAALCGQTAVDTVNSDPTIPIEDLPADALANANCKFYTYSTLILAYCPLKMRREKRQKEKERVSLLKRNPVFSSYMYQTNNLPPPQATPSSAAAPLSKTSPPPPCSSSPRARWSP